MKMPIKKQTVLSLAVAASLACVGGVAIAGYEQDPTTGSWTYTYVAGDSLPTNIFTNTGEYSPAAGATIKITDDNTAESSVITGVSITGITGSSYEIEGDIDITLENFTSSSFNGVYAQSSTDSSVVIDGDVTITASNMELTSTSSNPFDAVVNNAEDSYLEVGNITMTLTEIKTDGSGINIDGLHNGYYTSIYGQSSKAGNIIITVSDSNLASGRVAGVWAWDTVEVKNVTIGISNTTDSSSVYGVAGDGFYTEGAYFKAGDVEVNISNKSSMSGSIYGAYGNAFNVEGAYFSAGDVAINISDGSSMSGSICGAYGNTFNVEGAYFSAGDVAINISGSTVGSSFYGAYGSNFNAAGTSFSVKSVTVDISKGSTVSGNFFGFYVGNFNAGSDGSTASVGDVTIKAYKGEGSTTGSTLYGTIDGVHMNTVAANSVTFEAGDVVIDISDSSLSGHICGARIYGISGDEVKFTVGDITMEISGDATSSDIIGYRLGDNVTGSVTSTIGNIYIDVEGGTESGNFLGFRHNATDTTSSNSSTTIESIYLKVASLEGSAGEVHGVDKLNGGSLTISGTVTIDDTETDDAVRVIVDSATGSSVSGIYSTAGDVTVTKGNVSVTVTDAKDSDIHGVYATGDSISIGGDVKVEITGSEVGTESTDSNIYGVYNGTGGLSVKDISITLDGDSDNADVYGYYEASTASGTVSIGKISIVLEDASGNGSTESGSVYGFYSESSTAKTSVDTISISVTGTSKDIDIVNGNVSGAYVINSQGETTFGGISVKVSDVYFDQTNSSYRIYGLYTSGDATGTITINGPITVTVSSASGGTQTRTYAVYKIGTETLYINDDVTLSVSDMSEGRLLGIAVAYGELVMKGNLLLDMTDIHNSMAGYDNVTGLWVEGNTEAGSVANITGNIDVVYRATSADDPLGENDPSTFHQNIFGVGVGVYNAYYDATVTQTGDVTVSLVGAAKDLGMSTHSIYGVVVNKLVESNANFKGTNGNSYTQAEGYSRILSFGYNDGSGNIETFSSGSDEYGLSFDASFSNFDEVVVREGSNLYLTSEQNAHLIGDQDFFNFGSNSYSRTYPDSGTTASDYGAVEGFTTMINGLWSRGGVLYLKAADEDSDGSLESKLTLETGTTADILVVENNGTISIGNEATLITYSDTVEVETSATDNPSDSIDEAKSGAYSTVNYTGFNTGTIKGVDGVEGTGTFIVDAVGDLAESTFANTDTGTIEIHTLSVFGSLTNSGKIDAKTTTVGNTERATNTGILTNIEGGTVTTDSLTVVSSYSPAVDNAGTLTILAEEADSSIAGKVVNTETGEFYIGSDKGVYTVTVTSDGSIDTAGTLVESAATPLYVIGGTIANTGSFTANGTTVVDEDGLITTTADGSMTFANLTITKGKVGGAASLSGSTDEDGDISSKYTVVEAESAILTSGSFTVIDTGAATDGVLRNNGGTIDVGYTDDGSGNYSLTGTATLVGVVENSGVITVGHLDTIQPDPSLDPLQYTQTAGSFSVVGNTSAGYEDNPDWFESALVTITGGTIESYKLGSDNTYILGVSTAGDNPAEWPDKETSTYAWYTLGVLDTSSSVEIYGGSVLEVGTIDMTEENTPEAVNTIRLEGGTLIADFDQIFTNITYDTIYVEATSPEDLDGVTSTVIITGVGAVDQYVNNGVYFGEGVLGLRLQREEYFSLSATDSVDAALRAADNTTGTINVVYDGHFDEWLTVDLANQVESRHDHDGYHGYATYALDSLFNGTLKSDGRTKDVSGTVLSVGEAVGIGSIEFTLNNSMGFKSVTSVSEGVYINSGRIFNLVGETGNPDFELADLDDGAAISVYGSGADGTSTLELGSYGVSAKTGGTLKAVNVGIAPDSSTTTGLLEVKNGDFIITTLTNAGTVTVESNGQSELADNASLTVSTYTAYSDSLLTNSATFTATTANVQGAGEIDNYNAMEIGTLTAEAESTVNNAEGATLNLTDASTAGKVINAGTLTSADLTIYGASENTGTWTTSGTLTVSGAASNIANSSTIEADALVMEEDSSIGNTDTVTVSGESTIGGSFANAVAGTFEAQGDLTVTSTGQVVNDGTVTLGGDATISGQLDNAGTVTASGTITVTDNGLIANGGTIESDGALAVESSGRVVNATSIKSTSLTIADSGSVVSGASGVSGTSITTDSFTISGGSLSVAGGTFTTSSSTLSGGMVCVGFDCSGISTSSIKPLAADSDAVTVELSASGDMGSQVYVADGSKLNLGATGGIEWADNALGNLGISYSGDLLVMRSTTNIVENGTISVGSETENGGLYFASDSTLVIDINSIGDSIYSSTEEQAAPSAVFVSDGASNTVATVADGATLVVVGDLTKEGRYDITQGYTSDLQGWKDSFTWGTEDGTVYGVDSSGIGWELEVKNEANNGDIYIVTINHDDVRKEYPDINIPNIANDDLDNCKDGDYVCGILRDSDLDKDQKTDIINSSSTLLFDGGVTAVSRDGAGTAMDHLYNHLTMDSDTFDKDAKLWQYEESENIWVDVMGGWSKAKSLFNATGLSSFGYRNHSFGIITGWDHKFEDRPFVLGMAVSFEKGSLKSRGSVSATKNEYKNYGVHIFGNYSENEHLNLIGSLHWLHNNSGVNQSTGVSEFSSVSGSMHTNTFAAGLRAETMIKAGDVNIIPHVEARYMYGKTRAFDTKVAGTKTWRTKADGTHTLQIPFGVAFRADKKFDNGWNIRPNLDLEAIPQIGNTKQKTVVTNYNGVSDVIVGQFAGKWAGQARVGFQADKKNATVGAHYTFLGGNKGRAGHTFMLQARTRF